MVLISKIFFLCLLSVHVKVQVKGWCMTGCLTCNEGIPHCAYCKSGFYTVRDGAYSHCRKCPTGCALCSDPRYYPTNYCTECKDGYYGDTCSLSCSVGCYMSKCSRSNGTCYQNKCKPNFSGKNCDQCSRGRFGNDCQSACPDKCVSCSSETVCDECRDGFWGAICQNNCSRGCLEGICLMTSGACRDHKCKTGFVGEKCDRCTSGTQGLDCHVNEAMVGGTDSASSTIDFNK